MTAMTERWLLYGANGYTGELIAREAVARGMRPVLAGRSRAKVEQLAAELGCPSAVFELDDHTALVRALDGMTAVLHCAGPFSATARPMMQGCLATHVHYLDITGEIDVFELAHSVDEKAHRAKVVLCPGVGFDVVPTDSVAAKLKQALPDATHLTLGFEGNSGMSKGTAKTSIESVGGGSRVRRDGQIVAVELGSQTRRIDFGARRAPRRRHSVGRREHRVLHDRHPEHRSVHGDLAEGSRRHASCELDRAAAAATLDAGDREARHRRARCGRPTAPSATTIRASSGAKRATPRGRRKTARLRTANGYSLTVARRSVS